MEYGLRADRGAPAERDVRVLILVLMEYGLRERTPAVPVCRRSCLNPCFNGIWSARPTLTMMVVWGVSVLILVLMEYGLREVVKTTSTYDNSVVLILVLMEYGLRVLTTHDPSLAPDVLILVLMEYGLRDLKRR